MAESNRWDYRCPQYVDFDGSVNGEGDSFFDLSAKEEFYGPLQQVKEEYFTPSPQMHQPGKTSSPNAVPAVKTSRKSLSPIAGPSVSGNSRKVERSGLANKTNQPLRKNLKRTSSIFSADSSDVIPPVKKLAASSTPDCLRKYRGKKGTEDLQLESIAAARLRLAATRKRNESYRMKANRGLTASFKTNTSFPTVTIPKPFNFITDERVKKTTPEVPSASAKDFVASLRHNTPKPSQHAPKRTRPEPFNFDNKRRREAPPTNSQFRSLAEQVNDFQNKTPLRFRRKQQLSSASDVDSTTASSASTPPRLTRPKTPRLLAVARRRPLHVLSHQQQEDIEVENMKKYQFKAAPVNHAILPSKPFVARTEPKKRTVPRAINLETEQRYWLRERSKPKVEELNFEFHARPAPLKMLHRSPQVQVARGCGPVTEPKSPAFALKARTLTWKNQSVNEEPLSAVIKANPAPVFAKPFAPKLQHRVIELQPFSFEVRDKDKVSRKQELIAKELEKGEKMREFHAQPMPSPSGYFQPDLSTKVQTKPEPFQLQIDARGNERAAKWQQEMENELLRQKEMAVFKAKPSKVLNEQPFQPHRSSKPLTETSNIVLNTEQRASDREAFEQMKQARQAALETEYNIQKEIQDEEEQKLIAELRANAVHKANPIRQFRPMKVKPSLKKPTQPVTPKFATELRLQERAAKDKEN